jgi:hypothetical protein
VTTPAQAVDLAAEIREAQAGMAAGMSAAAARDALAEEEAARGRARLAARGEGEAEALARWEAERRAVSRRTLARTAGWGRAGRLAAPEPSRDEEDEAARTEALAAPEVSPSAAAVAKVERKARAARKPRQVEVAEAQEVMFR